MALKLEELLKLPPAEMVKHNEWPTMDQIKAKQQVYYDDVQVGTELPKYVRKFAITHFQRWGITMENTHRVHYDHPHAINHDKVPGVLFQDLLELLSADAHRLPAKDLIGGFPFFGVRNFIA